MFIGFFCVLLLCFSLNSVCFFFSPIRYSLWVSVASVFHLFLIRTNARLKIWMVVSVRLSLMKMYRFDKCSRRASLFCSLFIARLRQTQSPACFQKCFSFSPAIQPKPLPHWETKKQQQQQHSTCCGTNSGNGCGGLPFGSKSLSDFYKWKTLDSV